MKGKKEKFSMFKTVLTTLLVSLALVAGCQQAQSPVQEPNEVERPEKVIPFNVALDRIKTDLVGRWVTLDTDHRYTFTKEDKIELRQLDEGNKISDREVVIDLRIVVDHAKPVGEGISGFIKVRYEMVDGRWYLTEVIRVNLQPFVRKKAT